MTEGFGWIDHRIRHWLPVMTQEELLLYFFLLYAAGPDGISYYSTRNITKILKISPSSLKNAREMLQARNLIAVEKDEFSQRIIYQVLSLPIDSSVRIEIPMIKDVEKKKPGRGKPADPNKESRTLEPAAGINAEEQSTDNLQEIKKLMSLIDSI